MAALDGRLGVTFWLKAKVDAFVLAVKIRDDVLTVFGAVDASDCSHRGARHELAGVTKKCVQRFIRPYDSRVSETLCVLKVSHGASFSIEDVLQLRTCSIAGYGVTSDAVGSKLNFTASQLRRRRCVRVQHDQREREEICVFPDSSAWRSL